MNWGILFAVLVGVAIYVFQAGIGVGYLSRQHETYPLYKDDPGMRAKVPGAARATVQASALKQPCRDPAGRDESDLCAQYRAANNAGEAARWAYMQFVVSIFGVLGLSITVALTIRATNAAVRSNEISDQNGKRQLRAYMELCRVRITKPVVGESRHISAVMRNSGQTPARHVELTGIVEMGPSPAPEEFFDFDIERDMASRGQIGAGGERKFEAMLPRKWSRDDAIGFDEGSLAIYLWGLITYEDVFGGKRTTPFRMFHSKDTPGTRLLYCQYGNDAD